ncbi:hypothetical protein GWG65_02055 [Bradyrhizobium sp. CSA207]|uniref:hypothetical protein n=1 Tax=Bradyrhizobium sp. CSA207 TaxID=2698826 RepID=UPI0023AEDA8A|nr:hypothetical protein [Bradyrhizobium sp. CSA207]MDE5440246.1 hypothetical protein [Bradyrhizobium sp. CSA207]
MGAMSELAIYMEEARDMAADMAATTGAVRRCPHHEDVLIHQFDDDRLQTAYKLANKKITSGEITLTAGLSRRDFTDMIKEAVEQSELDCPHCSKLLAD